MSIKFLVLGGGVLGGGGIADFILMGARISPLSTIPIFGLFYQSLDMRGLSNVACYDFMWPDRNNPPYRETGVAIPLLQIRNRKSLAI